VPFFLKVCYNISSMDKLRMKERVIALHKYYTARLEHTTPCVNQRWRGPSWVAGGEDAAPHTVVPVPP